MPIANPTHPIHQFWQLIKLGNLDTVKHYYVSNRTLNISYQEDQAFTIACANGHLHIAQWLLLAKPKIKPWADKCKCYSQTAREGHTHVIGWLFELAKSFAKPTLAQAFTKTLASASYCGHHELVEWLFNMARSFDRPTLSYAFVKTFEIASNYRNREFIEWLCTNYDHVEGIGKRDFAQAFGNLCLSGYVEKTHWFSNAKPNSDYDEIFEKACEKNKLDVIKVFVKFNSKYKELVKTNQLVLPIDYSRIIPSNSIDQEDRICPYCWDEQVSIQTSCTHSFCSRCIDLHYCTGKNKLCPYCRSELNDFYQIVDTGLCANVVE